MKPHFGQSDAAMNKLAGCNKFPNAMKGLEQIAELEAKAREAGFGTPLEYLRAKHEEAAGMGLEPMFFERNPHLKAVNMTENMTPQPLPKGYYGHEDGCDCAVCEQCAWDESQRKIADQEWNKLLDDNAELWHYVTNYRDALERIVQIGESDSNFPQDGRMYDIAKASLAVSHKPR